MPNKKTAIVCTIGPASLDKIKELQEQGMALVRFNGAFQPFSTELRNKIPVPVLLDIPGKREKKRTSQFSDEELILLAVHNRVDYIGVSYVRTPEDVLSIVRLLHGAPVKIVAKIETKEAYENMDTIISMPEVSMLLIDRGDLGTAIGPEKVPHAQKKIIERCKHFNKPVIVATEMLMSTLKKEKPNCADVNDVYTAVTQGADFVMLSEETALGDDPLRPVKIMRGIIDYAHSIESL